MSYTGTRSASGNLVDNAHFFSGATGAVTAGQVLQEITVAHDGRIGGIVANGATAGTGAGNTVLDVQINGVSIYTGVTANRPTLAATSTGLFSNGNPATRELKKGSVLTVVALSISTTGHARISGEVCIEFE